MPRDIWVTSDLHYNHANILDFKDSDGNKSRNFETVDLMNECLLDNWNSVVKTGDYVYHLGDTFFGDKEKFKTDWPKFNGSKRLIVGNHDDIKFLSSGGFFKKVQFWRIFKEHNLLLHHVPLHISSLLRHDTYPLFQIHGHTHTNGSPSVGPYKSVCVELTDYTPVHIEELQHVGAKYMTEKWPLDRKILLNDG